MVFVFVSFFIIKCCFTICNLPDLWRNFTLVGKPGSSMTFVRSTSLIQLRRVRAVKMKWKNNTTIIIRLLKISYSSSYLSCGFWIVKRTRMLSTEKAPIISPVSSDKTSTCSKFPFNCSPFSLILNGRKLKQKQDKLISASDIIKYYFSISPINYF